MPETSVRKAAEKPPVEDVRKTFTNWRAFEQAKVKLNYVKCDVYREFHAAQPDIACHSLVHPAAENMISHYDRGHQGGFFVSFKAGYVNGNNEVVREEVWPEWKKFEDLGIEIQDFRCDICNAVVPLQPRHILAHLKPHKGKSSRVLPGGDFWLTISREKPMAADLEEQLQ